MEPNDRTTVRPNAYSSFFLSTQYVVCVLYNGSERAQREDEYIFFVPDDLPHDLPFDAIGDAVQGVASQLMR